MERCAERGGVGNGGQIIVYSGCLHAQKAKIAAEDSRHYTNQYFGIVGSISFAQALIPPLRLDA